MVALVDARLRTSRSPRSGTLTSTSPSSSSRDDVEAGSRRRRCSIARFSAITSATKRSMPVSAARAASCSSRRVPIPRPCSSSATAKAASAALGSRRRDVVRRARRPLVAEPADQRAASRPSRARGATRRAPVDLPDRRGSAGRGCARESACEEARAPRRRRPRRGPQPERAAVLEDDVDSSGCRCSRRR